MFITKKNMKLLKYGRGEGHFGLKEESNVETKMHLTKKEACPILEVIQVPIWIALYFTTTLNNTYLVAPTSR